MEWLIRTHLGGKSMRVALLSPFIYPIREPFAGGTGASIYRLASGLSRQGVSVVCYACEGSIIPGVEIRTCGVAAGAIAYPCEPDEMSGEEILAIRACEDVIMYRAIADAVEDPSIDVLHNNSFSGIPFLLSRFIDLATFHTLHVPPIFPAMTEALQSCMAEDLSLQTVAVSHSQAQLWLPYYPVSQVIYNGLDFDTIPRSISHDGTLAFAGMIDPNKGIEDAIEVASYLGKNLSIYGAPLPCNTSYFEGCIQPLLQEHSNVTYHGLVNQRTLFQGLGRAQALLFPVKWDEPFGNVIIEAMAVGTPVIMYDRGSAYELIAEDVSGYVVSQDNLMEMASAVERTETIDRSICADYVRERFSLKNTIEGYLKLLQSI
jgi:glycosyltransferase involved in cell wall biosynthesis